MELYWLVSFQSKLCLGAMMFGAWRDSDHDGGWVNRALQPSPRRR